MMKTVTIQLPDELFDRAQRLAAERGTSLQQEVIELVERFSVQETGDQSPSARESNIAHLFIALDKARNTKPIGRLMRSELYDRHVHGQDYDGVRVVNPFFHSSSTPIS